MIADSERREVAAKLRMLQSRQFRDEERPEVTTWEGIGAAVLPVDEWQRIDRFRSRDNRTQAVRSVIAGRLADLIEPDPDICSACPERKLGADEERQAQAIARHVVREVDAIACDRKALLELADELEEDACWEVQTPGDTSVARRLKDTCDRIREALGAGR